MVRLGVIRWDGYNGSPVWTQQQEFGFLADRRWHARAPWFVRRTGDPDQPLRFNPGYERRVIQQVTDQEIWYAAGAGVDYWAFCHFGRHKGGGWQLRDNFECYLASSLKRRIRFALICLGEHIGAGLSQGESGPDAVLRDWHRYEDEYLELFADPQYMRVCTGRPLFFLMGPDELSRRLGDPAGPEWRVDRLRDVIHRFRARCRHTGCGNPYIVGMNTGGIWSAMFIDRAGLDAVSAYRPAFGATAEGAPYNRLWPSIRDQLLLGEIGLGGNPRRQLVVPLMSGADHTPRHIKQPAAFGPEHYRDPRPGEFREHLLAGLRWTAAHPRNCPAQTVLVYAWNEHSEGGFVCPTMGDPPDYRPDTHLLDELAEAVRRFRAEQR